MTQLKSVTKSTPCPHCGKPDWCYCLGELSVCNRDSEPAPGWKATSKTDKDGHYFYAPDERTKKATRAAQKRTWNYPNRDGCRFVRVVRLDDGEGGKKVWQEHWNGKRWVKNLKDVNRADIPIYRYAEIREVIASGDKQSQSDSCSPQENSSGDKQSQNNSHSPQENSSGDKQNQSTQSPQKSDPSNKQNQSNSHSPQETALGKTIFIVEGETIADLLWELGIPATTNIGGSGKWRKSDSADLKGAKFVVLCPDRDTPGVKHMEKISKDFPDAHWLYAFPHSGLWHNLPKSKGLDLVDWIEDYQLDAQEVFAAVGEKRELKQNQKTAKPAESEDTDDFDEVCQKYKQILEIKCPGKRQWETDKLARKYRTNATKLMKAYYSARENLPSLKGKDIKQILEKASERFDWLVAGLMPMASTALLYAEAGTGKTLLVNSLIKAVAGGKDWNGYPTKHGKVLYVQTDEPEINTAHNLKEAGFESVPKENLTVFFEWQFEQMILLEEEIEQQRPKLVVIDSLTSSNRNATVEEKNVEYARGLYELRDIAMKYGCPIIVLHHENKNGGVRGSTAIKANVSEVWHLTKSDKLSREHRLLEIEKSRSGCIGTRQLFLDTYDLSWEDQGDFDPTQHTEEGKAKKLPISAKLLAFLQERPGVKFEPIELEGEFGSKNTIRSALAKLYKNGLIERESKTRKLERGNAVKYKVYFFPENPEEKISVDESPSQQELDTVISTVIPSESQNADQREDHRGKPSEGKVLGHGDQSYPKNPENFSQKTKNTLTKNSPSPATNPEKTEPQNLPSPTTNPEQTKNTTNDFQVGSKVAGNDPEQENYHWHGTIMEMFVSEAYILWDELDSQLHPHQLKDLRPTDETNSEEIARVQRMAKNGEGRFFTEDSTDSTGKLF